MSGTVCSPPEPDGRACDSVSACFMCGGRTADVTTAHGGVCLNCVRLCVHLAVQTSRAPLARSVRRLRRA